MKKHGHTSRGWRSPEYDCWRNMIQRCTNPKSVGFHRYGGRGIVVCDRWLTFENFLADMGEIPKKGLTLERKNNDGNYEPGNCRWATRKEQSRNISTNHILTHPDGRSLPVSQWAEIFGCNVSTLFFRIASGWTDEKILTTPIGPSNDEQARIIKARGKSMTVREWAEHLGLKKVTLKARLRKGWSVKDALFTPVDTVKARAGRIARGIK